MTEIAKFSDAVNLGLHAMIYLTEYNESEVLLHDMAAEIHASEAHLSKILQRLRKTGLVTATRGPTGGYRLAVNPAAITLISIVEAIDGPITPKYCLFEHPTCKNPPCSIAKLVGDTNLKFKKFLENTTLADFPKTNIALYQKS